MDTIPSFKDLKYVSEGTSSKRKVSDQEEMEKMFEHSQSKEEFSLNELSSADVTSWPEWKQRQKEKGRLRTTTDFQFKEEELNFHRTDSFPHVHHLLMPYLHHRVRRRKRTSSGTEYLSPVEENLEGSARASPVTFLIGDSEISDASPGPQRHPSGLEHRALESPHEVDVMESDSAPFSEEDIPEEKSPLLRMMGPGKPCIKSVDPDVLSDDDKKMSTVKFDIGEADDASTKQEQEKTTPRKRHHRRKHNFTEDPSQRRVPGSHHQFSYPTESVRDFEGLDLHPSDLADISSHRFDPSGHHRHHRVRAKSSVSSIIHLSEKQEKMDEVTLPIMRKSIDRSPHEVFVELNELISSATGKLEWKETARWIKYEEDVNLIDNRWGKPHLAFLNFHALFSLRKGLERGAVLLDLPERDLPSIAARVVDRMVAVDQIPADQRDNVVRVLLLRHRHITDSQGSFRMRSFKNITGTASDTEGETERRTESSSPLRRAMTVTSFAARARSSLRRTGLSTRFQANAFTSFRIPEVKTSSSTPQFTQIEIDRSSSAPDVTDPKTKELMRKIPEGSEATAVLVGAVDFLKQPTIAFVRLAEGVMMENIIEVPIPVRFMFVLLGPFRGEMDYHEVGRSISTLMSDKAFHEIAYRAHSRGQLLAAINEFLSASIVIPPSDWTNKDLVSVDEIREKAQEAYKKKQSVRHKDRIGPKIATKGVREHEKVPPGRDPLRRTGKLFCGLKEDLRIRMPKYLSDLKDGLDGQVFAAAFFIFFAALSAAITFGGMYGDKMNNLIGVGETLLVSSINGMIFALLGAQPLLIIGATGPLMIFDMSLYAFCDSYGIEFLPMRFWIAFWMVVWSLLITAFEAVAVVKKITRFTEEIFSTLVCLIFIYEAFVKLSHIFIEHPFQPEYCFEDINHTQIINGTIVNGSLYNGTNEIGEEIDFVLPPQPNTSLLSLLLMIGTFLIAYKLKIFRNSHYLGRSIRRALGDFGVPIAIILMVTLDFLLHDIYTDKLDMPDGLSPSSPNERGWIINPFGMNEALPPWCIFLAAPASLLLFILVFLEENICHLILSKPERKMIKGSGFHWDLLLSTLINVISGVLGAPFMGPACVRTVSHTSALTVMSSTHAPGESPKIIGVKVALSLVPKAVLFGIFLYMGVSSTAGIQFLERCVLFFILPKHHPHAPYVKKVRTLKMHIFTGIQLFLLAVLWMVKQSPAALCFPFVLILLVPIRLFLLPHFFHNEELIALDGLPPNDADSDDPHEPDFYEQTHHLPNQVLHDDSDSPGNES